MGDLWHGWFVTCVTYYIDDILHGWPMSMITYYMGDLLHGWLITSYCMGGLPCMTYHYKTDLSVMHLVTIFILFFFQAPWIHCREKST